MQWKSLCLASAQPFGRFDPGRIGRAILIAEPGDLIGIELDPPRGCAELVRLGMGAEFRKQYVFVGLRRDLDPGSPPERVEVWNQVTLRPLAEGVVEVTDPGRLVPSLREG